MFECRDNALGTLLRMETDEYFVPDEVFGVVERFYDEVRRKAEGVDAVKEKFSAVSEVLKENFRFDDHILLSEGVLGSMRNCRSSALLYDSALNELNEDETEIVRAPKHVVLRCSGDETFYWDPTTDSFETERGLKDFFRIPDTSIDKGVYLKGMGEEELIAMEFNTIGNSKASEKDFKRAKEFYSRSILLDDRNPMAYKNRSVANIMSGCYDDALNDLDKAIELDPKYSGAYKLRGHLKSSRGDDGSEDLRMSMRIDYVL